MDDDRIDFSSLDPTRDPRRFAKLVADVVTRAQPRRSLPQQLTDWARPVLVASAACAALAWTAVFLEPHTAAQVSGPSAELWAHWSSDTSSTLSDLIGGDDVGPW